jgi:hypothetical protein
MAQAKAGSLISVTSTIPRPNNATSAVSSTGKGSIATSGSGNVGSVKDGGNPTVLGRFNFDGIQEFTVFESGSSYRIQTDLRLGKDVEAQVHSLSLLSLSLSHFLFLSLLSISSFYPSLSPFAHSLPLSFALSFLSLFSLLCIIPQEL